MVAWEKVISALFPQEGPGLISLGMLCSPVVFLLRDPGQNLGPEQGPERSPMYTREEREGILWEFHRSGLGVRKACRELPLFPNEENLEVCQDFGHYAAR